MIIKFLLCEEFKVEYQYQARDITVSNIHCIAAVFFLLGNSYLDSVIGKLYQPEMCT
jgi:hypothetical protein